MQRRPPRPAASFPRPSDMAAAGPTSHARGLSVQPDGQASVLRTLPEEVPVAVVCNGSTHAVMMATPGDLSDFAAGFALTEGLIESLDEIEQIEIVEQDKGIEARLWMAAPRAAALAERRRSMAGPVGCGLCGIESLEQAVRSLPRLQDDDGARLRADIAAGATAQLRANQPLHDRTHAMHAAGFLDPAGHIIMSREDVGRHNALDKLIGALLRGGIDPASGAIVLTSRVSVEMVQKTVLAGCPILIAASAPTAHALRLAEGAGLTLAAFVRGGGFDLYSHPHRIQTGATDVA